MSPESLLTHRFTRASDVWAYGVAVYEVLTKGQIQPYIDEATTFTQVICGVCSGKLSLISEISMKKLCTSSLSSLLARCFSLNASDRPDMTTIRHALTNMILHHPLHAKYSEGD